jgi:hypothetical protein
MQVKLLVLRHPMTKHSRKRGMAVGWSTSTITKGDLKKAKKAGFLLESMEVIFPSDELVCRPIDGYRVKFLSFLLRGLSLPAHKFLCGLLFIYGVQLQ